MQAEAHRPLLSVDRTVGSAAGAKHYLVPVSFGRAGGRERANRGCTTSAAPAVQIVAQTHALCSITIMRSASLVPG